MSLFVYSDRVFLRVVSILTLTFFLPSIVGTWNFLPLISVARAETVASERAESPGFPVLSPQQMLQLADSERKPPKSVIHEDDEPSHGVPALLPEQMQVLAAASPEPSVGVPDEGVTSSADAIAGLSIQANAASQSVYDGSAASFVGAMDDKAAQPTMDVILNRAREHDQMEAMRRYQIAGRVVGGKRSGEEKKGTFVIRKAPASTNDAQANTPTDATDLQGSSAKPSGGEQAEVALQAALQLLSEVETAAATAALVEVADAYPRSSEDSHATRKLTEIAYAIGRGEFPLEEVSAIGSQLPDWSTLGSRGRYALVDFHVEAVEEALGQKQSEVLQVLFPSAFSFVNAFVRDEPTSQFQLPTMDYLRRGAKLAGGELAAQAIETLKLSTSADKPAVTRLAAHAVLSTYLLEANDPGRALTNRSSVIQLFESKEVAEFLSNPEVDGWVKADIGDIIGVAYADFGRFEEAGKALAQVRASIEASPGPCARVDYKALQLHRSQTRYDSEFDATPYLDYIHNYPDADDAPNALVNLAADYMTHGDYSNAADAYNAILEYYPKSPVVKTADQGLSFLDTYLLNTRADHGTDQQQHAALSTPLCGPMALAKVLRAQGIDTTVEELVILAETDPTGTTMQGLVEAAKIKGLELVGVETDELKQLSMPFIAYVNANHFVVVQSVDDKGIKVYDPNKSNTSVLAAGTFRQSWQGQALVKAPAPTLAKALDLAVLKGARGGCNFPPIPPQEECKDCEKRVDGKCVPKSCNSCKDQDGGGDNDDWDDGDDGDWPELVKPHCVGYPPGCPKSPTASTGIRSPGVNPIVDTFRTSLEIGEEDISIKTRGGNYLSFTRKYSNEKGYHRVAFQGTDKPYKNSIGDGWNHNYSMGLAVSSGTPPTTIAFYDADGVARVYDSPTTSGADYVYTPVAGGSAGSRNNRMTLKSGGTFELKTAGQKFTFSAVDGDGLARITSVEDNSGNQTTFTYDGAVGTGKLTKISSPSGDSQHLLLSYAGNLITKVELKSSSTVLSNSTMQYAYNGEDELTKVTYADGTYVEYAYASDGDAAGSRFIIKITDKMGAEADFVWHFDENALNEDAWEAYRVDVIAPNGTETRFDRDMASNVCNITVWDDEALLRRVVNTPVSGDPSRGRYIDHFYSTLNYHRWTHDYDVSGNHTRSLAPGDVTVASYTYTASGQLSTARVGSSGPIKTFKYASSTAPRASKVIAPDGTETNYVFDGSWRVLTMTQSALGASGYRYLYDANGLQTRVTAPDGMITDYEYNAVGNMTSVSVDPGGVDSTSTMYYDLYGNVTRQTDPVGNNTYLEYETGGCGGCGTAGSGRLTKIIDALSNETEFAYDDNGNRTKVIDALSLETDFAYDNMNRLTALTSPSGSANTATMFYDKLGMLTSRVGMDGVETTTEYDYMGRTVVATDPVGAVSTTYNVFGKISTVTDSLSHTWDYDYDALFHPTKVSDPISKKTTYFFDSSGRATKTAAGASADVDPVEYSFKASTGQMTKVTYNNTLGNNDATYYYDVNGRMTRLDDWMGGSGSGVGYDGHFFEYDTAGRMTRYRDFDDNPGDTRKKLDYVYDDAGRVLTMTDYEDYQTFYTYTATGRVSTITAPGSKTWDYNYNALGQPTTVTLPNGMITNYGYDERSRLTKIEHKDNTVIEEGWDYDLAANGDILRMASVVSDNESAWDYTYDKRHRLVDAIRTGVDGVPEHRESYVYDAGDNMLTKERVPLQARLFDDFSDLNYDEEPIWTTEGTWEADNGYLAYISDDPVAFVPQDAPDYDAWFSYYIDDSSTGKELNYYLRFDGEEAVVLHIEGTAMSLVNYTVDPENFDFVDDNEEAITESDQWYDVYVRLDGSNVKIWRAKQGEGLQPVLSTTTALTPSTNAIFGMETNATDTRFDNFRLMDSRDSGESFSDDFSDDDYTSSPLWSIGTGTWSIDGGEKYLVNEEDVDPSVIVMSRQITHGSLKFTYTIDQDASTGPALVAAITNYLDYTGQNIFAATPSTMVLQKREPSGYSNLSYVTETSSIDSSYDVHWIIDGSHQELWWGAHGGTLERIMTTDNGLVLPESRLALQAGPDAIVKFDNFVLEHSDPETTTYAYNDANELLTMVKDGTTATFTYDDWGRQVSKTIGGNSSVYGYRYGSKLKKIESTIPGDPDIVQYMYDGLNKRRQVLTTDNSVELRNTWYRHDTSFNAIAAYDGSGGWDITLRNQNLTYHGMLPIGEAKGDDPDTDDFWYYLHDHLGSTRTLYDESRGLLGRTSYTPFGEPMATSSGVEATYTYTGKQFEDDTGLYYFPYRYYSSGAARWVSSDPLAMVDGPNSYAYVRNNPIATIDILGLFGGPIYFPPDDPTGPGSPYQRCGDCAAPYLLCKGAAMAAYMALLGAIGEFEVVRTIWCLFVEEMNGAIAGKKCQAKVDKQAAENKAEARALYDDAKLGCELKLEDCRERQRRMCCN